MQDPTLLRDLRVADPDASAAGLIQAIPDRNYSLQEYQVVGGQWRYGIVPVGTPDLTTEQLRTQATAAEPVSRIPKGRQMYNSAAPMLLIALLLGFLSVIIAYYVDGADDGFNNFFNSNSFGPRFIATSLATIASRTFLSMLQGKIVI
jgi:hypothetical protein